MLLLIESDSSPKTLDKLSKLAYPYNVNYHLSIFIELCNNNDNNDSNANDNANNFWVDTLGKNAFNCRNDKNSNKVI